MSTLWVYNSTADVNAESEYVLLLAGTIPLLLFTTITVGGRLYVRIRTVRGIGVDDWIIVVTMVSFDSTVIHAQADVPFPGVRHHL